MKQSRSMPRVSDRMTETGTARPFALTIVGALALVLMVPAALALEAMSSFSPPDGKFTVAMEGRPRTKSGLAAGQVATSYAHEDKEGAYWVTFGTVPDLSRANPAVIKSAMDTSATQSMVGMRAKETARSAVSLQGKYVGRQVEGILQQNQALIKLRIYLVGTRLYQLVVVGSKAYVNRPASMRFLNSFSIPVNASKITPTSQNSFATTGGALRPVMQQANANLAKRHTEMQRQTAALHQKVTSDPTTLRRELDRARARAGGFYQ